MQTRIVFVTGLIVFAFGFVTSSSGQTYTVDNVHTSVIFSIKHFNIGYTYGRFNKTEGEIYIDETVPENSRFHFTIEVKSIDTNNQGRDQHLKGAEFFDAGQFPQIDFTSTSVSYEKTKQGTEVYRAKGILNLHGQERELTIPLQVTGQGKDQLGKQRIGFLSKYAIKRSDFGMDQMLAGIGDAVAITFSTEVVLKDEN